MPRCTSCSVRVSTEDVASSSTRTGGLDTAARAMAFALAEIASVRAQDGMVAPGEPSDEVVGTYDLCGTDAVLVCGVEPSVAQVVEHAGGEEAGFLGDEGHGAPEGGLCDVGYGYAVVEDGARLNVVEPVDGVDDGGFACTGAAYEGYLLSG